MYGVPLYAKSVAKKAINRPRESSASTGRWNIAKCLECSVERKPKKVEGDGGY